MTPEQFVDLLDTVVEREYYDNGQLKYEQYYIEYNKLHRINGPAWSHWHSNGQLAFERYFINDKLHRLDGPAYRSWYSDGQLRHEYYYIDGKKITKEEFENHTK